MKIAIHGRKFNVESVHYVQQVFDELQKYKVEIQLSETFKRVLLQSGIQLHCKNVYTTSQEIFNADIAFSLGGDGTFLETLSHVGKREIPILGFNFGRLGFLAAVSSEQIETTIAQLVNGQYDIDERTMLSAYSETELFEEGMNFALNEVAISKTDTSSMIVVHAYINGEFLNTYWADGLMVATATGSTGYSLSCGGPLVMPHSANFIITPICPHNLFVRPMIVSDDSVISLKVESRSNNYLVSMDSRAKIIASEEEATITVKKEAFKARMIRIDGNNFLNTLRSKLKWGVDARN
ncbi:NAD kinase [Emticicia sp. BO119]|uniref:NAD kinase n=1 Tax=Emticicia sp. BO119 TaxID=2757768 RepID=UPI0015F0C91D|nr:NAD kinase [Emticicia sp. BO119]MBA4851742.1 NAD kinase [Emticicia sp. BO119]